MSYVIEKQRRLIVTTGDGIVTFSEIRAHQNRLLSDPDFDAGFDQLIDVTNVEKFDMTGDEARTIAERPIVSPNSKRAFVATKPSIYGFGRLMAVYHESYAQVQIFYDFNSALKWLGVDVIVM